MPMRHWISLHPSAAYIPAVLEADEEEEGGEYLFDPEAGRASEDPFAHLHLEDAPSTEAASDASVSEYATEQE